MTDHSPFWGTLVAVALVSGLSGYYISQLLSVRIYAPVNEDQDSESEHELIDFGNAEEHKLVFVVRTDLGMTKGKIAAQCGHATLACYKQAMKTPQSLARWEYYGQTKIALKVGSQDDMLLLQATAMSLGLVAELIHDAGRTQIASGSATVLGIGPGPKSVIDSVTGHLSLL